jgi:NTE family protein
MKVGLALGGGGARGLAHIGVMRALEERGIEPVAVSGCSMGGIVGAFVANKIPSDEIRAAFGSLKAISVFDPRLDHDLKTEDFERMNEAIEAGYNEAVAVLDAQDIGS